MTKYFIENQRIYRVEYLCDAPNSDIFIYGIINGGDARKFSKSQWNVMYFDIEDACEQLKIFYQRSIEGLERKIADNKVRELMK